MTQPRPSDPERFKELLAKLAALDFKPVHDTESGWWTAGTGYDEPEPAVTLEDFFIGSPNNTGAFASNLPEHPGEDAIYALLQQMRARDDVQDLLVGVTQLEFNGSEDDWAYSDSLYIITTASALDISPESIHSDEDPPNLGKGWFGTYFPDDVITLTYNERYARCGVPRPPEGYTLYLLWWD
jgi:hypothetical protein